MDEFAQYGIMPHEMDFVDLTGGTTIEKGKKGLNWKGRLEYGFRVRRHIGILNRFYRSAIRNGECYYGPFKGEFGHFLLHNLPFLFHLYEKKVRIHYCGMELHSPFLVNENGESIIHQWYPLRDFFGEIKPLANQTELPEDVEKQVKAFQERAKKSGRPYLDISQNDLYWFAFRNWQLNGKQSAIDLSATYGREKQNTCVIFPRKKGGEFTPNNGGPWDYGELAKRVAPFFEKVFLVGHPSLSAEVKTEGNIELKVSANNADTLKYCAEARLIITQHSGAVHLGAFVKTPVLIIFNGEPPIKGLLDTIRFRQNIAKLKLNYAFSLSEIENFVSEGNF
ncbi:MAG TPA: hypothetical protein VJ911_06860 [Cryomorphaceae bacterium]|nr:hypothetical protein [Cryomorphaceae bacterium]